MTRWRTRLRGSRAERGAAAVEFAIVLTVLLLILFTIVDFGRLFFVSQSMKSASREGARVAAVRQEPAIITSTATSAGAAGAALAGNATMVVTISGGSGVPLDAPCPSPALPSTPPVVVTALVPFTWFTPAFLFASSINSVDASTTMRCE